MVRKKTSTVSNPPPPHHHHRHPRKENINQRLARIRQQQQQQQHETSLSNLLGLPSERVTPRPGNGATKSEEGLLLVDVCDEVMTEKEAKAQELEERMREENLEKMGHTLRQWLPESDGLASMMPDVMLAEQIVGNVVMEAGEAVVSASSPLSKDRQKRRNISSKSKPKEGGKKVKMGDAPEDNPFSRLLSGRHRQHPRQQQQQQQQGLTQEEQFKMKEEEQETWYFMSIWVQHHVEPVLKAAQQQQGGSQNDYDDDACVLESRSSSCSYILPFPKALGLLECMRRMTLSTAPPYSGNPFSTKPKRGTASGLTAYRM